MRRQAHPNAPSGTRKSTKLAIVAGAAAMLLTGCGAELRRGYLPEPVTEVGSDIVSFWNWTWIAALAVGVLVWGLTLWCMVAYRKRKDDDGSLPVQFRYNVPLEILYTVVPVLMVLVLFGQTVKVQNDMLHIDENPDVIVNVVGKKWSWDFNYVNEDVYVTGVHTSSLTSGDEGLRDEMPTMVLPVDARIEFVLTTRDVIHGFWVPNFLMQLDMMPGRVNTFQVTTTTEGSFDGKCAEFCGAYHSQMLFNVEVVSQEEYEAFIEGQREAGYDGQLGNDLNYYDFEHGQGDSVPIADPDEDEAAGAEDESDAGDAAARIELEEVAD